MRLHCTLLAIFCSLFATSICAQDDDIQVAPGDSLRTIGGRIQQRFGPEGLSRFYAGLATGLDARNGGAKPRLIRRELELGAPVPKFADGVEGALIEIPITAKLEIESFDGILRHLPLALHSDYRVEGASSGGIALAVERVSAIACVTLVQPLGHGVRTQIELRYVARFDRTRDPQRMEDRGFYGRGNLFWGRSSVAWYPTLRGQSAPGRLKLMIGRGWRAMGPGKMVDDRPMPEASAVEFRFENATDPWFVAGELGKVKLIEDGRSYEWLGATDREDFGRALLTRAADVLRWCEERGLPVPARGAVALQSATLDAPWSGTESWEVLFTEPSFTLEPELIAALVGRTWWWGLGLVRTSLDEALWTYLGRSYAVERGYRDDRGDWWANGEMGRFSRAALQSGSKMGSLRGLLRGESRLLELAVRAQMLAGKGALYFRALEQTLGRERFDQLLRHVRLFYGGQRVEADVWATLARERLGFNVDKLAAAWLDAEELSSYEIAAAEAQLEEGVHRLRVLLRAGHHPLGIPIQVAIETTAGPETHAIQPTEAEQEFVIALLAKPVRVELDPQLLLPRSPRTLVFEPTLERLTGAIARVPRITVVYPETDAHQKRATDLLERFKTAATIASEATILSDAEAMERGLPKDGLIALLGDARNNRAIALLRASLPLEVEARAVKMKNGLTIACPGGAAVRCWWFDPQADAKVQIWWTRPEQELPSPEDDQYVIYDGPYPLTRGWFPAKNRLVAEVR